MKKSILLAGLGVGIMAVSAVSVAYAATGNYESWKATAGSGRATSVITEKNFDQFTQMHQLMADGKYAEAQKLRTELGMGQGKGRGGFGMKNGGVRNFVDANNNGVCDHRE